METTITIFGMKFSKRGLIAAAVILIIFMYAIVFNAVANTQELAHQLMK